MKKANCFKSNNIFLSMKQAGMGIIIQDKKILLAKRSATCKLFPHHWCFPGGRGEEGETPQEMTVREVKEEINLEFENLTLFFDENIKGGMCYYFLGNTSGSIKVQESEISDCKPFTYDELEHQKIAFNHMDIIDRIKAAGLL